MITVKDKQDTILTMVCSVFGVTVAELTGKGKSRRIFHARCAYSYLTRHLLGHTYHEIADHLKKDRTSAYHCIESMNELIYIKDPSAIAMKEIEQEFVRTFCG